MHLTLNQFFELGGIPLRDLRLLRHKDTRAAKGRTPYELWRDDRPQFELYQSTHKVGYRTSLGAPYWASFVGTPDDRTLFVGLYKSAYVGVLEEDIPYPSMDGMMKAGEIDLYDLQLVQEFAHLEGRLFIEWGRGKRSWVQRAHRPEKYKAIVELREKFTEPDFPGFLNFIQPLSKLRTLPSGWIAALKATHGIYLLTCPKTKEQYVGKADGSEGFWGRWRAYVETGHGDNVALKSKDPSGYQVSILEVAGTAATPGDILRMESLWKSKLQSKEMGLNRN